MSKCSKCKEKSPLLYKRHGMVFCPTCLEEVETSSWKSYKKKK